MLDLNEKVCLVTGASRGIGRGIAIQLLGYGATCYITGRDIKTLSFVKDDAKSRGSTGLCIPVQCDHTCDDEVKNLFKKIADEQNGRLDLLVNNVFSGVPFLMENFQYYFWDLAPDTYDILNNVGSRSHYICAVYASRLMVPRRKGLIINVSSPSSKMYFLLPHYGIGKAGKDKMTHDCAVELKKFNVAFISLWPGMVETEVVMNKLKEIDNMDVLSAEEKMFFRRSFYSAESTELSGMCVAHLLADEKIINRTGQCVMTRDVADEFQLKDIDGKRPVNIRSVKYILSISPLAALATFVPSWLKIPKSLFTLMLSFSKPRLMSKQPSSFE